MKPPCAAPSKATKSPSSIASPCRSHREKSMSKLFRLNEAAEGEIYEIVSVDDTRISDEIGAYKGMSVVVLKKALQSIVQFGYSQIELELEQMNKIVVQAI